MSTLTVTNIVTANSSIPLTLTTGNAAAADIIVNNNEVLMFANNTTNVTINSTSIGIAGVSKVNTSGSTSGNQITVTQQLFLSGNVTPTKLAANTSDWDPATGVYNIRAEANSTTVYYSLFGLTAGLDGQEITITNINATPIIIRNEDSANEDTAVNRFNMPNHIKLDGYMSAQFYYDGTLSRWRLIDSINIPFDHKGSLTKGFMAGGGTPGGVKVATADKITYSTDTVGAVASANLSQARDQAATAGNADKGFFSGGGTPANYVTTADRTTYSTETNAAVSGANLSQARAGLGAMGNADKGFFNGGSASPADVATSGKTIYSTETHSAVSGANLSQARGSMGGAGNVDKGFSSGGSPQVTTTDRTTYSTETTAAVSGANLSQARYNDRAVGNADKGFFSAGVAYFSPAYTYYSTTDRITYSSETAAAVAGAALGTAREGPGNCGNKDSGYFAGGQTSSAGTVISSVEKIVYSNETRQATFANTISQGRGQFFGI